MAFDLATFRALYPQFDSYSDASVLAYYTRATDYVSPDNYGNLSDTARTQALELMTAHLLALNTIIASGSTPGVTLSATVDAISVTLQAPPTRSSQWRFWLNATPYGSQLLALLEGQAVGGFMVGGSLEQSAYRKAGGLF